MFRGEQLSLAAYWESMSSFLMEGMLSQDWLAYDLACMQTMRRLTESRPVDTPRQEFFTDAEIFACIVTFHLVAASGVKFLTLNTLDPAVS